MFPTPLTDPEDYEEPPSRRPLPPLVLFGNLDPAAVANTESMYRRLLHKVIRAARTTTIPDCGQLGMSSLAQALPVQDDVFFGGNSLGVLDEWDRNFKIGAAGELMVRFVFPSASIRVTLC